MADPLSNMKIPPGSRKKPKRVGRGPGSGHGKTSCRGEGGYGTRSGSKSLAGFEGGQTPLHRRLPKRGFKNPFKKQYTIINVRDLGRWDLNVVNPEELIEKGFIKKLEQDGLKLLGDGEVKKAYKVTVHVASRQAVEKVKKAGGDVKIIK